MAMGSGGSGGGLSSDINVTPMIDVLLVLLIIFMITLPLSRREFDVQVPPEQKQQPKQKQTQSDQIAELRKELDQSMQMIRELSQKVRDLEARAAQQPATPACLTPVPRLLESVFPLL